MTLTEVSAGTPAAADIRAVVQRVRATFAAGRTRPLEWRIAQLEALERLLVEREPDFAAALAKDLGRTPFEAWLADLAPVQGESRYARKHLHEWVRPQKVKLPLSVQPGKAWVQPEPLGVVGIIAPWNYPVFLLLGPLVGALAAGNCAVLKPSEHTPTVSALLADVVPRYLDPDAVAVVEGGAAETQQLLDQKLDHAFFTGGPEIAKAIMTAAAKHLTPVTLELGGKSPVIVAADADVTIAARRVVWTKSVNSGQTCLAPDYVLVDRSVREEFVAAVRAAISELVPQDELPLVHERRAQRIAELIAGAGGTLVCGGAVEPSRKRATMTVIVDPDPASDLMREEIFGPVLPIVTVDSLDDAIERVRQGEKPLAVYLFSSSRTAEKRVLAELSNGATVINHLVLQAITPGLPFGGVGNSGMGAYHGRWGFDTFSHRKAVLRKKAHPDPKLMYPPYTKIRQRFMRAIL